MKNLIKSKLKTNKYFNLLISLVLFVIVVSGCTDATFNPNAPIDTIAKEKEEKHKSTLEMLTKHTWQMVYKDAVNNDITTIMTLKFSLDGAFITEIFGSKTVLSWSLSEDSKYIITKEQDVLFSPENIDSLEILLLDENNLHIEVLNDNDPNKTILPLVPFSSQFAKFNLQSLIVNNTQNFTFPNLRLIIVWDVYSGGIFKQYIWGSGSVDSNLFQYEINFNAEPPIHCLNVKDSKKMLGFAKVILTTQTDLPIEGEITGKLDANLFVGGLNNKAIIYKYGDYTDEARPWIGNFGQSYNIAEASSDDKILWMNFFPSFPILEIDYIYNLKFPKL